MSNNNCNKKAKINKLANELKFCLDDEQINLIIQEYNEIESSLQKIKEIQIDNIQPTSFVAPLSIVDLNDDEYVEFNQEEVFKNSNYFHNGMVIISDKK